MEPSNRPPDGTVCDVVLVNYRSARDVARQLADAALQGSRVLVVDNGSEPEVIDRLAQEHGCQRLLIPENVGFAAAVNAAVRRLASDATEVLLLNPDVILEPGTIQALRTELSRRAVDGVAPLIVEPSGRLQVGAAGGPLTLRSVAAYFLFVSHVIRGVRGIFLTRTQSRRPQQVAWLCMACLLVRRDAFDRFGEVPEDELVYAEDVAWGTTASRAGARWWLASDISVVHAHGSSGASNRWIGALERLLRRRLGGVRGRLAVAALRCGLFLRQSVGRRVSGGPVPGRTDS